MKKIQFAFNMLAALIVFGLAFGHAAELKAVQEDPFAERPGTPKTEDPFGEVPADADPFAEQPKQEVESGDPFAEYKEEASKAKRTEAKVAKNARERWGTTSNKSTDQILSALEQSVRIDYFEVRFGDVLDELQASGQINIVLDESSLDNNLDEESLITRKLDDVSMKSAIQIICKDYDCGIMVKDEVLYIASNDHVDENQNLMIYDCRKLAEALGGDKESFYQKLTNTIQMTVDPDSWKQSGGMGTISEVGGFLVIRTTFNNHDIIEGLLNALQSENAKRHPASK